MTKRSRQRGRKPTEPDLSRVLKSGLCYEFDAAGKRLPVPSEAELRAAWQQHRDSIMADYRDRPTRPWAWWQFDCTIPGAPLWPLWTFGTVGGIDFRRRNRPSDFQQREFLAKHNLIGANA